MMDIYIMQYIHRSRYLIVINENTYVSVYKYEKYKFDEPVLTFQTKKKTILMVSQRFLG